MKKSKLSLIGACLISGCLLFNSCIGSFGLFNKVLTWNQSVGDKFVNELVFLALCIVPVYEIAMLADFVVFNSIEFWTDENPVSAQVGEERMVKGENGDYLVRVNDDGYTISKGDQSMDLQYDRATRTWNADADGHHVKLVTIKDDGTAFLW
jgi:hypothetical protein